MNKGVLVGLLIVGLVGCATKPTPQFTESDYRQTALHWHGIHQCVLNGVMSPELGAVGRRYVQGILGRHQYNQQRMEAEVKQLQVERHQVTLEDCRILAMSIQETQQNIALQNENTRIQQQAIENMINSVRTTQTYCSTIGGIVQCNSF